LVHEPTLARLYLEAVLPCLEPLTENDGAASLIAEGWSGGIRFGVGPCGPCCTVRLEGSRASVHPSAISGPDVALFFPHPVFLNNLFRGRGVVIALPWKGITRIRGLKVFSRLAGRMQDVLEGRSRNDELRALLMLGLMARALAVLAESDPEFRPEAARIRGVAEFGIAGGPAAHVAFSDRGARAFEGKATSPDLVIGFADSSVFLGVADDRVDVMAEACMGGVSMAGDLHMGQTISWGLDMVGRYMI
jgi:hypothetical protein